MPRLKHFDTAIRNGPLFVQIDVPILLRRALVSLLSGHPESTLQTSADIGYVTAVHRSSLYCRVHGLKAPGFP